MYDNNNPKPKTQSELRADAAIWERLIIERYHVVKDGSRRDSTMWLIRIKIIHALVEDSANKVKHGLTCLAVCDCNFDMYQHLAFLIRVAERFGRTHWVEAFRSQQDALR